MPARALVLLLLLPLAACASSRPDATFPVAAGGYAQAFDAAREAVRDRRFPLERVDAAAGVIATAAKSSPGLAAPWDTEQTTLKQEADDLLNYQARRVRITFEPAPDAPDGALLADAPLVGRVEVTILRTQYRGVRAAERSIRQTSFASDPIASARGLAAYEQVPLTQDGALARRIADSIASRLAQPTPTPPAPRPAPDAPG